MFTFSKADACREVLLGWRVVSLAGALALCALSFALGLAFAPLVS